MEILVSVLQTNNRPGKKKASGQLDTKKVPALNLNPLNIFPIFFCLSCKHVVSSYLHKALLGDLAAAGMDY